jgi:foldase protein PrsA
MENDTMNTQASQQKTDKKSIKISIKTASIVAVLIILGALAYVYKGLFIAATIDGSPISRLTIIKKLEKASGKSLLESLIVEKLIQNEANAKKIVVSNDEIDAEFKKIEGQVSMQGGTLDEALSKQGMTRNDLKKQIILNKEIEKLLGDKINVTDEEIGQYIKDNKISIPNGQEAAIRDQIKDGLRNQKLNAQAQSLIAQLKSKAKIQYFVNY